MRFRVDSEALMLLPYIVRQQPSPLDWRAIHDRVDFRQARCSRIDHDRQREKSRCRVRQRHEGGRLYRQVYSRRILFPFLQFGEPPPAVSEEARSRIAASRASRTADWTAPLVPAVGPSSEQAREPDTAAAARAPKQHNANLVMRSSFTERL